MEPQADITLTDDVISKMTARELIQNATVIFDITDEVERTSVQAMFEVRARELNVTTAIRSLIAVCKRQDKKLENDYRREVAIQKQEIILTTDDKGIPTPTIENFLTVMRESPYYAGIKYNLLTNAPEIHSNGKIAQWLDADESESRKFIESEYGIYNERKHYDALRILFREREYNPIQDVVDSIEWDGTERCEEFLVKWGKADDSPYTREVSRLIFAGGIHRIYEPGCKFDDVPVLIGTHQGEGKSTLVRWLAIHDKYFSEVTEMDGQRAIEQLAGAWICEIAELLAMTKAKEVESVKSYITRQRDKYRKPYDKQTSEFPRRCIFIGTTNNEQFLRDRTGNRRFYPVRVHSIGYELFDYEQECRDYIIQCWAEARVKYQRGEMPSFARKDLLPDYKAAQDEAMEDDWRVGVIEQYLDSKPTGGTVCAFEIAHEVLYKDATFYKPDKKESAEINKIVSGFDGWENVGRKRTENYGQQRCWVKLTKSDVKIADELPF